MDLNKQPETVAEALALSSQWNFKHLARIAQLEAELAEARSIIEAERQGWKIALRALINEPQHAAIIGNPASAARAEIHEIGEALLELSEARKDSERAKAVVDLWFAYLSLDGPDVDDIQLMLAFGKAADATKAARGAK